MSYKKNEQVQQANLFKRQTLTFHFQRIIQIHLNIYHICQQISERLMHKTMLAADYATDKQLIAHQNQTQISGHLAFSSLPQKDDVSVGQVWTV